MNPYLKNLSKIEFAVTYACTGRCRHCSEGDHEKSGERIDPLLAVDAVRKISQEYNITTVMAFGGEPLLYTDAVYSIMKTARELDIKKRQVITNGFFSNNIDTIRYVARELCECGVNDLLLSVDAFHEECIPTDKVKAFAAEAKKCGIPIRLQPAWLVSRTHPNPYNERTRTLLDEFAAIGLSEGEGNVIFPEGNARKYLSEYFSEEIPKNPYVEDPYNVRCVSFSPNGDVLGGNVYECDILEIIKDYEP